MNILFVEDSSNMGGVQESTLSLAENLINKKTYNINVLVPQKGEISLRLDKKSIPFQFYKPVKYLSTSIDILKSSYHIINPMALFYNLVAIIINSYRIKKLINRKNDFVVTKGLLNHFCTGFAVMNYKNIKLIWHLQDLITSRHCGLARYVFNYFARIIPDKIICDGRLIQKILDKNSKKKSIVILNGIKTKSFQRDTENGENIRKEFNIPENAYVLGHLGRITYWKGQLYLLKAFLEYVKHNDNAYLLLVGSPIFTNHKYMKSIVSLINKSEYKNNIKLTGYRTDLKDIFSAMDLFIYPSIEKDTTPLSLISAMASGLPVVVSEIESLNDIINLSPQIDTFKPKILKSLVYYMRKYEDESKRKMHAKSNIKIAKNYFDIEIHSKKMILLFNQMLASN
tara:strand:- start:399 stop:1592 length:1194 start_codon:yes stop_codon:yes gene_type:complete